MFFAAASPADWNLSAAPVREGSARGLRTLVAAHRGADK